MKKLKNTIFGIGVLFVLFSGCSNGSINNPDGIPDGWIIETVGRAEEDDETSLALDSNGNPHISYNQGTELGYAY